MVALLGAHTFAYFQPWPPFEVAIFLLSRPLGGQPFAIPKG
ncbi:hypothetical protein ABIB36_001083 [Rhodococcus sp. UYP9]